MQKSLVDRYKLKILRFLLSKLTILLLFLFVRYSFMFRIIFLNESLHAVISMLATCNKHTADIFLCKNMAIFLNTLCSRPKRFANALVPLANIPNSYFEAKLPHYPYIRLSPRTGNPVYYAIWIDFVVFALIKIFYLMFVSIALLFICQIYILPKLTLFASFVENMQKRFCEIKNHCLRPFSRTLWLPFLSNSTTT